MAAKRNKPLSEESTVVVCSNLASCDLEGDAVILNLGTGLYHGLNDVGSSVWKRIQSPTSVAALRDALLAEYRVDADTCLSDLLAVLEEMRTAELIEVRDGKAA